MKKFLLFLVFGVSIWGNPQGPSVNSGNVQIAEMGPLLQVQASDRSIIDWHSFSIAAGETTRFILPSIEAAVLNRVTGSEISQLMGRLEANGAIYLVNPNGIVVGKEGQISAAAFFGSSLSLSLEDFLKGGTIQAIGDPVGTITNLGVIQAAKGPVTLLSHKVENEGIIEAKNGRVNLLSGHEILLDPTGDSLLFIRPGMEGEGIDVAGTIEALEVQMETAGPYGIAIGLGDCVDASVIVNEKGTIYLRSHNGPLEIDGNSALIAPGGEITLLGDKIEIEKTLIDASGNEGGGTIRIGRKDSPLLDARAVTIGEEVEVKADALLSGHGGDILIWSTDRTQFDGSISAQAFGEGGNGGMAEVSGKKELWMTGFADLRAVGGKVGTLTLDPGTIVIEAGSGAGGPNTYGDAYIQGLLDVGNVTLNTATEPGGGAETITVQTNVFIAPAANNLLTLIAGQSITFQDSITIANSVAMTAGTNITFGDTVLIQDFGAQTDTTWTASNGSIAMGNAFAYRNDEAKTLTLSAASYIQGTGGATQVIFQNTYAGATSFNAFEFETTGAVSGNYAGIGFNYANISASRGGITMTGVGGDTGSNCRGLSLVNCALTTNQGNITLHGTGGGSGAGTGNVGVYLANYLSDITISTGAIAITGIGGSGTTGNYGIQLNHPGVPVNPLNISGSTSITLHGTGGGTSTDNDGIKIGSLCTITGTGTGTVSLTGIAAGTSRNGINLAGGDITAVNGTITFSGAGTSGNGILVQTIGTTVETTGSGSISFTSTAGDILIGYNGTGGGIAEVIASGTGSISMTAAGSLSVVGGAGGETSTISISNGAASTDITLLAGVNLTLSSSSGGIPTISNAGSGDLTLVADNAFPASSGPGQFNLSSNGVLTTAGGELRIYTVSDAQNTIDAATINGLAYPTSSHEISGVYYPSGSYVSPSYTIYYKSADTPPAPAPEPAPAPAPVPPVVVSETTIAIVQPIADPPQIVQQTTVTNQQPTATPDTKKGCRTPSVAVQAL